MFCLFQSKTCVECSRSWVGAPVKPQTLKLVSDASPLSTQYKGARANNSWL